MAEGGLVVLALVLVGLILVVPLAALVVAIDARGRARRLESRTGALETWLAALQRGGSGPARAVEVPPAALPATEVVRAPVAPAVVAHPVPAPPPPPARTVPASAPRLAGPAPVAAPTLEERIGVTWFTRVGAAVLVLGALYFFKYAVDNDLIGPWGRVALGVLAGIALLVLADRLAASARPAYVQGLLGVALALLYVSSYAAYGFYRLLPLPAAFLALVVVAALGGALAMRHAAQLILVMALLAALANPVLLTTGEDRPLALFAYLLLATGATLAVALKMRFALAAWLAIGGAVAHGIDWHATFFRFHPPRLDPIAAGAVAGSAGAYFELTARLLPILLVLAFVALWVAAARAARRRGWREAWPTGILLAGILAAHLGLGALLLDRPALLAAAMAACGAAAAWLLRGEADPALVGLPLVASFLILAGRSSLANAAPLAALLVGGGWIAVYGTALLRRARAAADAGAARAASALLALAATLAAVLAGLEAAGHPRTLACALVALAAATALVAPVPGPVWFAPPSAAAAAIALLAAALEPGPLDGVFLALTGVWGAVWIVSAAHGLLRRAAPPAVPVLTASAGALAFVAVVLQASGRGDGTLRALCAAAAGAAVFGLGVVLLRRRSDARDAASVLLAEGVALLALATALAFSGVTITLVWAALAAVVAVLAAQRGDPRWLAGAGALFLLVVARALLVDAASPADEHARFVLTLGREGELRPMLLLNPRALALAGVAAALLVAARAAARRPDGAWRNPAGVAATVAHALLLGLVVTEVVAALLTLPAFPGPLAEPEFHAFMAMVAEAARTQANRLAVGATLAVGGYGALLLCVGFAARSVLHRWLGLVVLAATVGKLALWDIWNLPRLYQVLVLVTVGTLLLGAGFLYARFGNRLLSFLRSGAAAGLLLLVAVSSAGAVDERQFSQAAEVPVPAAGDMAVEVSAELYRASRSTPVLADLRVVDPAGREVAWFLRDLGAVEPAAKVAAELLEPVATIPCAPVRREEDARGRRSRLVLDTGGRGVPLRALLVEVLRERFQRRVLIEATDRDGIWAAVGGGVLFRARGGEGLRVPAVTSARYLRLTVDNGDDPPLDVGAVRAEYRRQEIVFAASGPGVHRLLLGVRDLAAPAYDLAAVLRGDGGVRLTLSAGPLVPNPSFSMAATHVPRRPWTERFRVAIGVALGLAMLGLAAWTVKMLQRKDGGP